LGLRFPVSLLLLLCIVVAIARAKEPKSHTTAGLLLVANQGEHTLMVIEPETGQQLATIPVGVNDHEVAVSPDGRFAYVPIYGNSGVGKPGTDGRTIDVIDLAKRKRVGSIDLEKPVRPHRAAFGPDGLLYVSAELANAIYVVDTKNRKVAGYVPTGQTESHMFVISLDGKRAFTSNVGAGSVSVVDLRAKKTLAVIPVAKKVQRIAISADGKRVFTFDQDQPRMAVINTGTNQLERWVQLPAIGFAGEATQDGRALLVVLPSADKVVALSLPEFKLEHTIVVPESPSEILVRPDGRMAYVSCLKVGKVVAINLDTWAVEKSIAAGQGSDGLAWVPGK
jgi:DNA-binding beta-propeller fold protein YncE